MQALEAGSLGDSVGEVVVEVVQLQQPQSEQGQGDARQAALEEEVKVQAVKRGRPRKLTSQLRLKQEQVDESENEKDTEKIIIINTESSSNAENMEDATQDESSKEQESDPDMEQQVIYLETQDLQHVKGEGGNDDDAEAQGETVQIVQSDAAAMETDTTADTQPVEILPHTPFMPAKKSKIYGTRKTLLYTQQFK